MKTRSSITKSDNSATIIILSVIQNSFIVINQSSTKQRDREAFGRRIAHTHTHIFIQIARQWCSMWIHTRLSNKPTSNNPTKRVCCIQFFRMIDWMALRFSCIESYYDITLFRCYAINSPLLFLLRPLHYTRWLSIDCACTLCVIDYV